MDEAWTFRDLLAAGWTEDDLEWERLSEAALSDLAAGRDDEAFAAIRAALHLARGCFAVGDPRIASSLTSQAAVMAATDPGAAIDVILRAARQAWRDCETFVADMAAPRRARSSMFHLRMERLHRETYAERWREMVRAELGAALAGAETPVLVGREEAGEHVSRWKSERPAGLDDFRKVMGAIILLAAQSRGQHVVAPPEAKGNAGTFQREER